MCQSSARGFRRQKPGGGKKDKPRFPTWPDPGLIQPRFRTWPDPRAISTLRSSSLPFTYGFQVIIIIIPPPKGIRVRDSLVFVAVVCPNCARNRTPRVQLCIYCFCWGGYFFQKLPPKVICVGRGNLLFEHLSAILKTFFGTKERSLNFLLWPKVGIWHF